jgi:4-coumarate--CoA ligase (photoactive yellow protein activation family)
MRARITAVSSASSFTLSTQHSARPAGFPMAGSIDLHGLDSPGHQTGACPHVRSRTDGVAVKDLAVKDLAVKDLAVPGPAVMGRAVMGRTMMVRTVKGRAAPVAEPAKAAGLEGNGLLLRAETLERFSRAVLAELMVRWRGAAPILPVDASLREGEIGLDSLELLEAVASLNTRFSLQDTGIEDYLLVRPTLRDWGRLLQTHLARMGPAASLTFRTSGSEGEPKEVRHPADRLLREAEVLSEDLGLADTGGVGAANPAIPDKARPHLRGGTATRSGATHASPVPENGTGGTVPEPRDRGHHNTGAAFGRAPDVTGRMTGSPGRARLPHPARRIVSLVPCHTMFGFLFTALLPDRHGWSVVDLSGRAPSALARVVQPGDIVVATPHLLSLALRGLGTAPLPANARAIVSGGPVPASLWRDAAAAGLALVDVYGSTETGGIGWRSAEQDAFTLFSHLDLRYPDTEAPELWTADERLALQDRLDWRPGLSFTWHGRLDNVVQVGGVNVSPSMVARSLGECAGVREAAVRFDPESGRLKAFIVPKDVPAPASALASAPATARDGVAQLERALRRAMSAAHAAPARPQSYTFGERLPLGPGGKPCDWR